jgi:hypothetical protein
VSKPTVVRLFIGSIVAVLAGIILGFGAVLVALASDSLVMDGPDVVGIESTGLAWALVVLAAIAVLAMIGGAIVGMVSWIGALLNTAQLEDKTWFVLLLVLGLLSFGIVAMIAYVIGGPDGMRAHARAELPSHA